MGATYQIFGKQVPAYVLSLATLGSVAAGVAIPKIFAKEDPNAKQIAATKPAAPVTNSKEDDFDLEKFINDLTKEETK
ncbi:unnamed protein product [Candida verbasci]|uniref:ATP synthase subunit K, mitochondrial n=1 Tax=Candida verbasci TaxID=1227364 RepID=A0A9W4TQU8_9ASCO|nr:unnamed protein product [Candida verbasci]